MLSNKIKVNTKVQEALENNKSIVALESTLISHGLPYPENINVAKESIKAVEDSGSVAATIGIINGDIIIGLDDNEIEILATSKNVEKVSLHNIALSLFHKHNAATTVATTINIASKVGIIIWNMWRSRSNPTKTNENLYQIASSDFEKLITEIQNLDSSIKEIETYLEENEVPFTPGRGLILNWKKE